MAKNITRRGFVGVAAAATATAGAAGCAPATQASEDAASQATSVEGFEEIAPLAKPDPTDLELYQDDMPLSELTKIRRELIDACEDYVCEDGTVIPKIWVQVREVVHGLGHGNNKRNKNDDTCFAGWQYLCNHDEKIAHVYVNSPIGKRFTAFDVAVELGLSEEEAAAACDALARNGMFMRTTVSGVKFYQHQRVAHGITESSMNLYGTEGFIPAYLKSINPMDFLPCPYYYPVPVNKDIVIDDKILPYDDIEALLNRHEVFAASPCQCVYLRMMYDDLPAVDDVDAVREYVLPNDVHLEKCYTFGEEAQFYIDQGIGRQVTRDEMRELLQRSVDEGCVMESCYTKYTEVICSCDGAHCGNLPGYVEAGTDHPRYPNLSHYNLMYNKDTCIKCGSCSARCPVEAIEMNDEGFPEITSVCIRCGQCAYICPSASRKLKAKDQAEIPYMAADLLEWANLDTMYRYKKGMWGNEEVQA